MIDAHLIVLVGSGGRERFWRLNSWTPLELAPAAPEGNRRWLRPPQKGAPVGFDAKISIRNGSKRSREEVKLSFLPFRRKRGRACLAVNISVQNPATIRLTATPFAAVMDLAEQ